MSPATLAATLAPVRETPLLRHHVQQGLFIPELKSKRKSSILEEMVATLAAAGVTRHPEGVLEAVRRREALGSTSLGKGIAVPHARSTLITERAVVVARSRKGTDFDAPDGQPTHLWFMIVGPPIERDPVYLNLMAEIVRSVRLAKTRQRLLDAPDYVAMRRILVEAAHE
jgi:mannitol/fructose-specific phosphotransferase system IIA component (Ntr-type)